MRSVRMAPIPLTETDEVDSMFESYQITNAEYEELHTQFGRLACTQAWELLRKNTKNNHTDDFDDIVQDIRMALVRAGVYHKRQVYIKACFEEVFEHVRDKFVCKVVHELESLWTNRTRHGANRRKFGLHQERMLESIVNKYVPENCRPQKDRKLVIDPTFTTYCKSITWNQQKSMGKRITREKSWRTGLVSLSEYDYLGQNA
jgi:hypothetical protein